MKAAIAEQHENDSDIHSYHRTCLAEDFAVMLECIPPASATAAPHMTCHVLHQLPLAYQSPQNTLGATQPHSCYKDTSSCVAGATRML